MALDCVYKITFYYTQLKLSAVTEELLDTQEVIRIRNSKKNRHNGQKKKNRHNGQKKKNRHNGQKKRDTAKNNDLQNIHIKLKIE